MRDIFVSSKTEFHKFMYLHHKNISMASAANSSVVDDNTLIISLLIVIIVLILAGFLFVILRWCYKKRCKTNHQIQTNHQSLCERHCPQCRLEGFSNLAQDTSGQDTSLQVREETGKQIQQTCSVQTPSISAQQMPEHEMLRQKESSHASGLIPADTVLKPDISSSRTNPNVRVYRSATNPVTGCSEGHDKYSVETETLEMLSQAEGTVRDLLIPTDRSLVRMISGKLLIYITHLVDSKGDVLVVDDTGVSLHIPRDAVGAGKKVPIVLGLSWDLSDAPPLNESQAHVSPVIYCGPHGQKLEKPCLLEYKHCAYDAKNITILVSETEITEEQKWKPLCGNRTDGGRCVVTQDTCHVRLDHFTLVTSIQTGVIGNPGKKWLQTAVFASSLDTAVNHLQVRTYFFNKTPCNLQWAIYNEIKFGGKLVCPENTFLFSAAGGDMHLKVRYLSECWSSVYDSETEKVSFLQIWHNQCPHASLSFKRVEPPKGMMDEINIQFIMYQEKLENDFEKIIIHMIEERTDLHAEVLKDIESVNIQLGPSPVISLGSTPGSPKNINVRIDGKTDTIPLNQIEESLKDRQTIPLTLKHQLVLMLDPRCPFQHDWRGLAAKLGLDRSIPYLESKVNSPTSAILQYMEEKRKTLLDLYNILKDMEREDAASFVEKYLINVTNRLPSEGESN